MLTVGLRSGTQRLGNLSTPPVCHDNPALDLPPRRQRTPDDKREEKEGQLLQRPSMSLKSKVPKHGLQIASPAQQKAERLRRWCYMTSYLTHLVGEAEAWSESN